MRESEAFITKEFIEDAAMSKDEQIIFALTNLIEGLNDRPFYSFAIAAAHDRRGDLYFMLKVYDSREDEALDLCGVLGT